MIDTYFDRADRTTGYSATPRPPVDRDDPRYWNGSLYDSVINRMVAEARYNLRAEISLQHQYHGNMIRAGFNRARTALGVQA